MLAVASWYCKDQWVVTDLTVHTAPCRHIRAGVGPADTDAALVCCLPAVAAAAHPVVVISQCNNTHAKFLCQLYCTVHSQFCI